LLLQPVEFVFEKGMVTAYIEDHDAGTPIHAEKLNGAWLNVYGPGRPAQEAKADSGRSQQADGERVHSALLVRGRVAFVSPRAGEAVLPREATARPAPQFAPNSPRAPPSFS
jgi:hypothetical protein